MSSLICIKFGAYRPQFVDRPEMSILRFVDYAPKKVKKVSVFDEIKVRERVWRTTR
jgi:hypothetical protein